MARATSSFRIAEPHPLKMPLGHLEPWVLGSALGARVTLPFPPSVTPLSCMWNASLPPTQKQKINEGLGWRGDWKRDFFPPH